MENHEAQLSELALKRTDFFRLELKKREKL